VEFGERAADSALRELREELGAEVTDLTLLGVSDGLYALLIGRDRDKS
jgi:ADP-ribose pyrophosphatase YjhB (NUDIX family)